MGISFRRSLVMLAVLGSDGCADEEAADRAPAEAHGPCPIAGDFGWDAFIAAAAGSTPILEVSGWVDLELPDRKPRLVAGTRPDRMRPATKHLRLVIEPKVPGDPPGPRYFVRTALLADLQYRAVAIECGGAEIERISEIDVRR